MSPHTHYVNAVMWSYDQKLFASVSLDNHVKLYDVENNYKIISEWKNDFYGFMIRTCAFSRDSKILIAGAYNGSIIGYNTTGKLDKAFVLTFPSNHDRKFISLIK